MIKRNRENPLCLDQTVSGMSRVKNSPGCQSGKEPHCQRESMVLKKKQQVTAHRPWESGCSGLGEEAQKLVRKQESREWVTFWGTEPSEMIKTLLGTESQDKGRLDSMESHVPRRWDLTKCSDGRLGAAPQG